MWRTAGVIIVVSIAAYVAINALVTTEPERVEAEVERLLGLAREGGEGAVEGILGALAEDYRGSGSFDRARIEFYLKDYLGKGRIKSISTGDYKALWVDEEIVVPILRIIASTDRGETSVILRVTFGKRDGTWKIVDVSQWSFGR
jgi:hypothetical protein